MPSHEPRMNLAYAEKSLTTSFTPVQLPGTAALHDVCNLRDSFCLLTVSLRGITLHFSPETIRFVRRACRISPIAFAFRIALGPSRIYPASADLLLRLASPRQSQSHN